MKQDLDQAMVAAGLDAFILTGDATLCLLYTSDAADERSSVDLGGRRIIKKKTKIKHVQSRLITKRQILREIPTPDITIQAKKHSTNKTKQKKTDE